MTATPPNSPDLLPPNSPKHTPEPQDGDRDAERVNKRHPLSFVVKILLFLLGLFLLVCATFYYMAGTSRGTEFFIDKIINETGVTLEYDEGNLRDGLLVKSVKLKANEDIDVHFINAYVKIGWRALFLRQVHLREATIEDIVVTNTKPPTGEPFDYKRLDLPVDLIFDTAKIDHIAYKQVTREPIIVSDVYAKDLSWVDTKVSVDEGDLQYADIVNIADLSGYINLEDNYPLNADAVVTVQALEKIYVDPLSVTASGSLKRTTGKVTSLYNNQEVEGVFRVQGMDKNAPFYAKLWWDEVTLPYAESQDIHLSEGLAVASGVTSDIDLRIRSELMAKDIPSGLYQGRAKIVQGKMLVDRLKATTDEGDLLAQGVLNWQDDFTTKAMLYSRNYQIRPLLPESAQPYAPKFLDGKLAVVFQLKNQDDLMQINAHLDQRDGEVLHAKVVRGNEPENAGQRNKRSAPWYVDAKWRNLTRIDVPDIDNIDSPYGNASVTVRDNRLWVDADAKINELNVAPAGDYAVKLSKVNDRIDIGRLNYNGVMGDLTGNGQIVLASKANNRPLAWQLNAKTQELLPQTFNADLPVSLLTGFIDARGTMQTRQVKVGGKTVSEQTHDFRINDTDLKARLTSEVATKNEAGDIIATEARRVMLDGKGDGKVTLRAGQLQNFDARFNGQLNTQGLPQGTLTVDANGTLKNITVKTLRHDGEAGAINAAGKVNLSDGIGWDIKANAKAFDVGFFAPQTEAVVTGNLITSGKWLMGTGSQNAVKVSMDNEQVDNNQSKGRLGNFAVKFDGSIDTPRLPSGSLAIDASGDASVINVNNLRHVGEAGKLQAKGNVDVRDGLSWDIKAVMDDFNVAYFVKDFPSRITGRIRSNGNWGEDTQRIRISQMNLAGQLKGKPITASGDLNAVLHLPKDFSAYADTLKTADYETQADNINQVVQTLDADNLRVAWADNVIVANGNNKRLEAKVNISNLNELAEPFNQKLNGQLAGGVTVVQDGSSLPSLFVNLTGKNINLPSLTVRDAKVLGKVVNFGQSPSQLSLKARQLGVANREFNTIEALYQGTASAHTLNLKANTQTEATAVGVTAKVQGGLNLDAKTWSGVLANGRIATDYATLSQRQPAEMVVGFGEATSIKLASHCWQTAGNTSGKGSVCLREPLIASDKQGKIDLNVQNLDTSLLAPVMPKDLSWQAKVNGNAKVNWQQGSTPSINATVYSDNGKFGLVQDADLSRGESQTLTMGYDRVSVIAKSVSGGLKLRTDIKAGEGASGYADVVVDPSTEGKPIAGAVVLKELDLAILQPFFPGIRTLRGNVTMAGTLGGSLASPKVYGDFNVKNTAFALLDLPISLTNINAKGTVQGKTATIDGTFMSGEGKGTLSGAVDWQQDLQAKLGIRGERLVITQPPLLYAQITPDINVIVKPKQRFVDIEGVVTVPTATLRPPEANGDVITKSDDVVVLDRRLVGNIEEVLAVTEPWSINADVGVDLGSDVKFRGFGAVLPLAGAINIRQQGQGVMTATGVVQVSRKSNIDAFGQSLELQYGQVRFAGDVLNPRLSIEASKEIEGQTVGVRVKDRVSDPNITVFNNAGLTQQQAMNALITGRISNSGATQISEEGFKSEVSNTLAAAGLSYGLSGTRNLTNSIGQAFGLQRLTLDASGTGNDANVNLTGYITPDLYIRYGVGVFNAQSALSLRYQLTRRVYVEATSAAENAVDVFYSFQF